jgi:diguanylate cyclase (GGDEF)-like protein
MAQDITKQLERARRSLEKNKLRDALAEYQAVFDESPANQEAIQALADLYQRLNEPLRAAHFYGLQVDRLLDSSDTAKAAAIFARFLRDAPQPPDRLIRFGGLLQKQGRAAEAAEQFNSAAERFHELNKDTDALACYERIAQLDAENPSRHLAVAELAGRLGQTDLAARSFLRAGQLSQSLGDMDLALEYFNQAHRLLPGDRTVSMFFAEARLRRGDAAGAVELLAPFSGVAEDTTFLAFYGEALLRTGQLDRAREAFESFYRQKQDGFTKMFELAGAYFRAGEDQKGAEVLAKTKAWMYVARRENEFAAQVDRLATLHPNSLPLAQLIASLYEELNREAKYFDSLVRLFDLYLDAGQLKPACDTLDRLVDIDPYDYRNQQRIAKLEGKADPAFLRSITSRAAKAATVNVRQGGFNGASGDDPEENQSEEKRTQQALDDLLVQVEIFLQYSLHSKAVERLERIGELFPGEEDKNERLRNVYERANWWPKGKPPAAPATPAPAFASAAVPPAPLAPAAGHAPYMMGFDPETQRDLAEIASFTRLMYRQATPKEVVHAAVAEIGKYLQPSRCVVSVVTGTESAAFTAEFTGPGIVPLGLEQVAALQASLATTPPDALGGVELTAVGATALSELKLQTALGVRLVDKETRAPSGALLVCSERPRKWRPNESFFLQAVGDQILISVNHTRTQAAVRTMAFADEKTGLVSRGAYLHCVMAESLRARAQNAPLSMIILQIDGGAQLMQQFGDTVLESYVELLARSLRGTVRQTDVAVKYTAWSLAFILPDTGLASAKLLTEKLQQVASTVNAPWSGQPLHLSAVVAEATSRPGDDNEDRVTEWINRVEAGIDEIRQHAEEKLLALATP